VLHSGELPKLRSVAATAGVVTRSSVLCTCAKLSCSDIVFVMRNHVPCACSGITYASLHKKVSTSRAAAHLST
jgi:hypothetical protein